MIIDFTTIEHGESSCYETDCKMVIVNSEQWSDFWQLHVKCECILYDDYWDDDEYNNHYIEGKPRIPEIDFNYYSVIVVVIRKPSTRYITEILSVKASSSQSEDRLSLFITFRCQLPQSVDLVGHMVSSPFHLIKIPKIDTHEAIFKETKSHSHRYLGK